MEQELKPIIESYNVGEEYLYNKQYLFIKGFATGRELVYTLKALPLARKLHDGQYRKGIIVVDGKEVKLPYVLHVLKVCSTLISLELPMYDEELDILCSAALCHDMLEDCTDSFTSEDDLVTKYGMPQQVLDIVKLVSKKSGANEYELNEYFNNIKYNKYALLVKLADRSHNVETLSSMKIERLHKYVEETRRWIYPLCSYGKQNYPELSSGITILKSKILSLTEATELLVDMFMEQINSKDDEIKYLYNLLSQNNISFTHADYEQDIAFEGIVPTGGMMQYGNPDKLDNKKAQDNK